MKCSPPWIATREPTWMRRARRKPHGVTLVELTVALAVLGLLVLALAQATEHASKTVFSGTERMQISEAQLSHHLIHRRIIARSMT